MTEVEKYEAVVPSAEMNDDILLARALAKSGYYKDIREASQGIVKIIIAREFGLGLKGISDVHIVEGKPTLSYQAVLGMVRRYTGPLGTDRYSFRYVRRDEECVEIEWLINGEPIGTSKCDSEDAKRMGVGSRQNWQKFPRQMRTARAVTEGVNAVMPEVIGGSIYGADELGDESVIDGRGGVSATPVASSDATPLAPSTLTLKPADAVEEKVEAMVAEAIETMDAAEETVDGELVDPSEGWIEAAKAFFGSLSKEEKVEFGKALKIHGYLPEGKLTQAQVFEALADTLGPRCAELDIVMQELAS